MTPDFSYLLRVRYSECDAQKVVFNAKYAEYADIAITEYMRVIWGCYQGLLDRGLDNQVVDLHISWQAPAHFDDVLQINVKTLKIGNTSYSIQADFIQHSTQQVIATAVVTYVMVTAVTHNKLPIPHDIRTQLEQGAQNIVINHAGI